MQLGLWRVKHWAKLPAHHCWSLLPFQHIGLFLDSSCPCNADLVFVASKASSKGPPTINGMKSGKLRFSPQYIPTGNEPYISPTPRGAISA